MNNFERMRKDVNETNLVQIYVWWYTAYVIAFAWYMIYKFHYILHYVFL